MAARDCCPSQDERNVYYDVTKYSRQAHFSGLNRVSRRLREALAREGEQVTPVRWSTARQCYVDTGTGSQIGQARDKDLFITPEVFSLSERPFMRRWMRRFEGTSACIFYDAIPFFHPESTWPKSVRRFPKLLADLAAYDKVFYISRKAAEDAKTAADNLGIQVPQGNLLVLGSDYRPGTLPDRAVSAVTFLHVGILEPRKQQSLLLDACARLWQEGFQFKVVFLGRVNPHFGKPIISRIKELQSSGRDLMHIPQASDEVLAQWHAQASLLVSPSVSEGFGLPVLEALWAGCPVVASRQPACEYISRGSGCVVLDPMNAGTLYQQLLDLLKDPESLHRMEAGIDRAKLPVWRDTALQLLKGISSAT